MKIFQYHKVEEFKETMEKIKLNFSLKVKRKDDEQEEEEYSILVYVWEILIKGIFK